MLTKIMRYEIVKPVDIKWETLGEILRNLQYDTRRVMNKTIQLLWEWDGFCSDYKKQHGAYPKANDVFPPKTIGGEIYAKLSGEFTRPYSANLATSMQVAYAQWKIDRNDVFAGRKSIASYTQNNTPIDLHNQAIQLTPQLNGSVFADLALVSKSYKTELELNSCRIKVLLDTGNKSSKSIIERCLDGEYKVAASKIIHRNDKWYLNLTYVFKPTNVCLDENRILGVDLGIVNAVYLAICGTHVHEAISGGEVESFRKQIERRKRSLQKQGKYCGNGRIGHGIHTRIASMDTLKEKIGNFRNTVNHNYSRYIIEFAQKHDCGTIQLENLDITSDDRYLESWPYSDLRQKISYKAAEAGIKVRAIDPHYTSQRCSRCGYIDSKNRLDQARFVCQKCGFEANADYNAALNIATPNIESVIEETLHGAARRP